MWGGALDLDKILAHRSLSHHTRKGACDCDLGPDLPLFAKLGAGEERGGEEMKGAQARRSGRCHW